MITIGITGGIGAGKSVASQILGELGAEVIDADIVKIGRASCRERVCQYV